MADKLLNKKKKLFFDILSQDVLFSSDYQPEFIFKNQIIKVTTPFSLKEADQSQKLILHTQTTPLSSQQQQPPQKARRKRSFFLLPFTSSGPKKPKKQEYLPFNVEDKAAICGLAQKIDDFATHIHLYTPILNPAQLKKEKNVDIRTKETEFYLSVIADENLPTNSAALEEMKQEFLTPAIPPTTKPKESSASKQSNQNKSVSKTNNPKPIPNLKPNIEFCSSEMSVENCLVADFGLKKVFFGKRKQFLSYMKKYIERLTNMKIEKLMKTRKDVSIVEQNEAAELTLFIEQTTKFVRYVYSNFEEFRFLAGNSFSRKTSLIPKSSPFEEIPAFLKIGNDFVSVFVEKNSTSSSSKESANNAAKKNHPNNNNNQMQEETFVPGNCLDYPSDGEKLAPDEKYVSDVNHLQENPFFDDNIGNQMMICQKMHSNGTFSLYFFTEGLGMVVNDDKNE